MPNTQGIQTSVAKYEQLSKLFPPIDSRGNTQQKNRIPKHKLTDTHSSPSFDVGLVSDKALKLLEMGKNRVKSKSKAIWKPSGAIKANDGYTTKPKVYY